MVAPPEPGATIGSGEQSIDFCTREEPDQGAGETLAGDGEHALDLCRVSREREGDVAKERVNGGEPQITAANAQPAALLEVIEKRHDQRRIDLLEHERGRRLVHTLLRELEKQAESVAVGADRVGADLAVR